MKKKLITIFYIEFKTNFLIKFLYDVFFIYGCTKSNFFILIKYLYIYIKF